MKTDTIDVPVVVKPTTLTKVELQLDWFPEPAHGGFYQAQARGFYADAGLEVVIYPGGPGGHPTQKVAAGQVPFSMGRSDDMMLAAQEGLPVLIVAALMQHDPQALLMHASNPVDSFADLDGKAIMAHPGAGWLPYLKKRYDIEFDLMPLSFGLARFIAEPDLIQACFVTDEPYTVRAGGIAAKTLLIADAGYDPYRVIVAHAPFASEHPDIVRAFVAATIRGWRDYIDGDPGPAHQLLAQENDHLTPDLMDYSWNEMRRRHLVDGNASAGESIGHLDPDRLSNHEQLLRELKVLTSPLPLEDYVSFEFLPTSMTR